MVDFIPLPFWQVRPELAEHVYAPAYDSIAEAHYHRYLQAHPQSFLQVSKPDPNLAPIELALQQGAQKLQAMLSSEMYQQTLMPSFYVYGRQIGQAEQVGLVGGASVADYLKNRIRRLERTYVRGEIERLRHLEHTRHHSAMITLVYPENTSITQLLNHICQTQPCKMHLRDETGVAHAFWQVSDSKTLVQLQQAFANIDAAYIGDGHHRVAAAARWTSSKRAMGHAQPQSSDEHFMAAMFGSQNIPVFAYHRVVQLETELPVDAFLAAISQHFTYSLDNPPPMDEASSDQILRMCLAGRWYGLQPHRVVGNLAASLALSHLHTHILEPLLGITNPWHDHRITYCGGPQGTMQLQSKLSQPNTLGFWLPTTKLRDIFQIADQGALIPPKSVSLAEAVDGILLVPLG